MTASLCHALDEAQKAQRFAQGHIRYTLSQNDGVPLILAAEIMNYGVRSNRMKSIQVTLDIQRDFFADAVDRGQL